MQEVDIFVHSVPNIFSSFMCLFVYSGRVSLSTISIKKHDTLLLSTGLSNLVDCSRSGEIPRKYIILVTKHFKKIDSYFKKEFIHANLNKYKRLLLLEIDFSCIAID